MRGACVTVQRLWRGAFLGSESGCQVSKSAHSLCWRDSLRSRKLIVSRAAIRKSYSVVCNPLLVIATQEHPIPGSGCCAVWPMNADGLAEGRRANELRGNEKDRAGRLRNGDRKNRADKRRKRARQLCRSDSRVGQRAHRTRVICRAGTRRMNVNGGNKPGQRDQDDAAYRHGGIRPASGPQVGLRLHAGSLNQYDAI